MNENKPRIPFGSTALQLQLDLIDARVKLKKQGKNFHACCPFHNEKTPSFTVNG
ncbi:CHC2 zinc finger domain-containing protein, partial [Escherichia coli]|uniref:CHC2 zinc finger domain-containing protein n=1 Tax=Escherichia coli TaxID=562 RepID=UPI003EE2B2B7